MFESLTAVILLIVFVVPGYVWRIVEGQFVQQDKKGEWEVYALELLTRSTVLYLPTLTIFYLNWKNGWHEIHPWRTGVIAFMQVVVAPMGAGFVSGLVRQRNWISKLLGRLGLTSFNPVPSAWDAHFRTINECWVIVTLKNGKQIHGYFGPGSQASSDPENRDIFISHTVVADESGFRLVPNTGGVYVPSSEIQAIEFIKTPSEDP